MRAPGTVPPNQVHAARDTGRHAIGREAQRRLAAIVVADVVGFSRMMAADETGAFHRLKRVNAEVIDPLSARHRGRVVKLVGDGLLLEFASVVDAVGFAVAFQTEMATRNAGAPPEARLVYRMGVNFGDVIGDGDDVYGDGVNLAARLEPLSPPGGVCVSAKVHDEVRAKLDVAFEAMGPQRLKNIPAPLETFAARIDPSAPPAARSRRRLLVPAAAAVVVGAVAVAFALLLQPVSRQVTEPASVERMAHPLPDKPSIAVLPFEGIAAEQGQDWFADGMTEDLITDLSKVDGLFVIARNSSFAFKDRQATVREAAEALGVRYVLQGSVRRADGRVRINAQLVEATTGGAVWADRYEGAADDVFALQDEITASIIGALTQQLQPDDIEALDMPGTENPAAHDAYLRGLALYRRGGPDDNAGAEKAFARAIELDPGYNRARTGLAKVYVQAGMGPQAYAEALDIHWSEGLARAWRLLDHSAGQPDADRHVVRSWLALRKHQHDRAVAEARRALELEPNNADAMEALAEAEIYAGDAKAGRAEAERARRQNPGSPGRALYLTGLSAFALDDPEAAVRAINGAIAAAPARRAEFSGVLAAALARSGRIEEAQAAFEIVAEGYLERPSMSWTVRPERFRNPRFHTWRHIDVAWVVFTHPFRDPLVQERFAGGLRAAGAPAGVAGYISLHRGNRLSGREIENLLFGAEIAGRDFWRAEENWRQLRHPNGAVVHYGAPIHAGPPDPPRGTGQTRDDVLCEQWPLRGTRVEICVSIYRMLDDRSRLRWGDYVMVTDLGPFPFSAI